MISCWKTAHIVANLGNDNLGSFAAYTRNRIKQFDCYFKRATVNLDFMIKTGNGFFHAVDLAQQLSQNKTMMRSR